ncbi:MAG: CYTH and CHAD domain-containing protein [Candidatus Dormibacteria bacterium]
MPDTAAVERVGLPLAFSMSASLRAAGFSVLATQVTRETLTFHDTPGQRLAAAGAELSAGSAGWRWFRGSCGHPKLRPVERVIPPGDTAVVAAWTRAYRRGRPLEARVTARLLRRVHTVRGVEGATFIVVEERLDAGAASLRRASVAGTDGVRPPPPRAVFGGAAAADAPVLLTLRPRGTTVWRLQPPPPGAVSAPDLLRRSLARSVAQWLYHDSDLAGGGDDETVHQVRVALRRLRSDLQSFAPLLDEAWARGIRGDLRDLAAIFGEVRDAEVREAHLAALAASMDGEDGVAAGAAVDVAREDGERARRALLAELDGASYPRLADRIVTALGTPRWASGEAAEMDITLLARRPYQQLRRRVGQLPRPPQAEDLHRVRILAKRARYAAEACIPACGEAAAVAAERVAAVQTVLGDHHDAVVARAWLRACAERVPAAAYGCGLLAAAEARRQHDLEETWLSVWREASRPRVWKWLGA